MELGLARSRVQPGLRSVRVSDQTKLITEFQRNGRSHHRCFDCEIQHPSWCALLWNGATAVRGRMECKRGCPRLVHHKIYFLLLFPLEEPCDRRTTARRRLPGDLRIRIAGLIFPQALEVAAVPGPWRLLGRYKHSVNPAAKNLLPSGPQICVDPQRCGHIKPSPQTPDSETRLSLDANSRPRPQPTPEQSDFRGPRPKLKVCSAFRIRATCNGTWVLKLQPLCIGFDPDGGFAILRRRHNRHADIAAQPAPRGAREGKLNPNVLPFASSKTFLRLQKNRYILSASNQQGNRVITGQECCSRGDQPVPQPSPREPWHNARPRTQQSHDPHKRVLRTEEQSCWAKPDSLPSLAIQKRVGACWFPSGFDRSRQSHALLTKRVWASVSFRHDFDCFYGDPLLRAPTNGLSRHFNRFQYSVDYLANLETFHLELRPQQHAVLQYRGSKRLHVLRQHELAFFKRRQCPRR